MIIVRNNLFLSFMLTLIGLSLLISSCEHDYYMPKENEPGSGSSLFGDSITVPSTFSWETMGAVKVNVTVDDQYNGNYFYMVELFDSNPLFNENATLLGKGVAKKNNDFSMNVALPHAVETIFLQQTNPTGGKTIAPVDVISTSLSYAFSTVAASVRSSSINDNEAVENMSLLAASDQYTLPPSYQVITQTSGQLSLNLSQGPYLLNGNFSGKTNFWGAGDIYVTGTLDDTQTLQIPASSRLIVLDGGNVKTNRDLQLLGNALFYNNGTALINGLLQTSNVNAKIVNDHILNVLNVEITQNSGQLTNNGTLNVSSNLKIANNGTVINNNSIVSESFTLENGLFENNGTVSINGQTQATNSTVKIINNGSFTSNTMLVTSSAIVENNCHLIIDDLLNITDATIKVNEGALLTTSNLLMNNTRIELGSAAMMNVTTLATFMYNSKNSNHGFYGTGTNKALLRITKAVQGKKSSYPIIHYQGNMEIECYDHPSENIDPWNTRWTQNGVTWAGEGGSTLVIGATECNDGGYGTSSPGTPANPIFPIIYEGTDMTYLFEDNWPYLGDFDMNDLVLDLNPVYTINAEGKVAQLQLEITLRAVGATKGLAVGLQLDGIVGSAISGVSRSNTAGINGTVFSQSESNGLESGQTYAVIPVFDDVHSGLGYPSKTMINTVKGSSVTATPMKVVFTLSFSSPVENVSVTVDKFNMFIINGGYSSKRHEIHLSGFQPTDKADRSRFGFADDNSNSKFYTSKDNQIWGLAIPGSAKYPIEWTSIRLAYPAMESWATSGGESSKDWYKQAVENLVYTQ